MDEHGGVLDPALEPDVTKEEAVRMYQTMVQLNVMDSILYEAQRQARSTASLRNLSRACVSYGPK
jgi:2-oxoisovalerate dehydrogenase E1 component alpha subunit